MAVDVYLRFADLKKTGIVTSRTQLNRLIKNNGFPRGRLLSENCRVWSETEIESYMASRPIGPQLRGAAKIKHAKKQAEMKEDSGRSGLNDAAMLSGGT